MKKLALAMTVSVVALTAPAMAKDGFYMGLGLTYNDNDPTVSHSVVGGGWFVPANRTAINAAPVDDLTTDSYGASVFAGYKTHLVDEVMFAIEADANVFDGKTEKTFSQTYPGSPPFVYNIAQSISQQWISTVRGKLGIDIGAGTIYVTGGAAFTDVEVTGRFSDNYTLGNRILNQGGRSSEMATGYVWGGGLDLGLGGSTSLRIEYLHHDFGTIKGYSRALTFNTAVLAGETLSNSVKLENDTFRVGMAWDLNL
jgi:outer membrane immunogenic protein